MEYIRVHSLHYPIQIISWQVKKGQHVSKDEKLGIYAYLDEEDQTQKQEIRSQFEGKIEFLEALNFIAESEEQNLGGIIEDCTHAVQLHGLCALCGKDLTIAHYTGSDTTRVSINLTHESRGVKVSHKEATRIELDNVARLKKEKKLILLLDLDQTVVHATIDDAVRLMLESNDRSSPDNVMGDIHSFTLSDSPIVYYIKLRPETRELLEDLYDKYEMHIYTMGTKNYAYQVAKVLDPTKKYFQDRILSRDDSGSFVYKTIKRLFPIDQSMVVAIDDRADVWQWSPNLIKVRPYNFFLGIGDINEPDKEEGAAVPSSPDSKKGASDSTQTPTIIPKPALQDDDRDLKYIKRTMTALHATFFNRLDQGDEGGADVCHILPWMKKQILAGVHLVFSGIVPVGHDATKNDLWIQATQFGATCSLELSSLTTHLIARKTGTAKVNDAKELSCYIVKPEWLLACLIQWHKVPEDTYYLDPSFKGPSKMLDSGAAEADWSLLDKEVDALFEGTDDDSEEEEEEPENAVLHVPAPAHSEDDDSWLENEIGAELDKEQDTKSEKRGLEIEEEVMVSTKRRRPRS